MELVEFLQARITEDEAVARAAAASDSADWFADGGTLGPGKGPGWHSFDYIGEENARHAARHDPARVYAECEAKLRIASNHGHELTTRGCDCEMHNDYQSFMDCGVCVEAIQYAELGGWCLTLRALALPYVDHPDYDEAWRP